MKREYIYIGIGILVVGTLGTLGYFSIKNKVQENKEGVDKDGNEIRSIGKTVNVSKEEGYTNVRETPKVDRTCFGSGILEYYDACMQHNLLAKVEKNPLGVVKDVVVGEDGFNWYEIELSNPIDGRSTGYARMDAIGFK
jgi:hypothetical protein